MFDVRNKLHIFKVDFPLEESTKFIKYKINSKCRLVVANSRIVLTNVRNIAMV